MANNTEKEYRDEYKIVVVGVGGTGGLLARDLARYLYSLKTDSSISFALTLIDGDRVSESNVSRQPFLLEDVGQFKVDCLSEAFEAMYDGVTVYPVPVYLDTVDELAGAISSCTLETSFSTISYNVRKHLILIGAVDNHRARQVMYEYFENHNFEYNIHDVFYIDSANEFDYGTCVCGYRDMDGVHCPSRAFFFPNVLTDKGKRASEISCGEINVSAPQHLATNLMAAQVVLSRIVSFITSHETPFGVTTFFPFLCQMQHRDAKSYGIENFLELWQKDREKKQQEVMGNGKID